MKEVWKEYFEIMQGVVQKAYDTQGPKIMEAAKLLAECTKNGGLINLFGSGHSSLVTEDVFWRAACMANTHAIFESAVAGINEITKTSKLEKIEGIGQIIVQYNRVEKPDVMICVSNSGNNAATIDVALECKGRGVPVIAFTNPTYADKLATHHSSGKKLKDIADVVIDNCSLYGDAAVKLDGLITKVGATSTIPVVFMLQALLVQTCQLLLEEGITPEVWYNGHLEYEFPEVKDHNKKLVDKYYWKVRNL
ncbi:MAG: sugar isomerase domain-containing protein [Erysipelotrichia bacterium]|nr:sugar isomerase domain-containing protein [Erysipelotrichia bacterium]